MMKPTVLLYDEPTSTLDPSLRREVVETLRRVRALDTPRHEATRRLLARSGE